MVLCAPVPAPQGALETLYDAVAAGMWAYTRTAFRVVDLGTEGYRPRRGLVLVSTHRAETDVPLICPSLYIEGRYWNRRQPRVHFAARDDMFDRGFFGGFPPGLPLSARRLLFAIEVGALLPLVRVHPVPYPSASLLRLGKALASIPGETPLSQLLPAALVEPFDERAAALGRRPPETAGEVLSGSFADLLWRFCTPEEAASPVFERAWRRRAEEATAAIRSLVELVASGEMLLLFPEGRPSPDGAIGPLRRGLGTIVRRGSPEALVPVAIAYDPITRGRPWAYVSFGSELDDFGDGIDDVALTALKRTTPLTCGQVVARELLRAAQEDGGGLAVRALDAALVSECAEAFATCRPLDRALLDARTRRDRLTEALGWCLDRGLVARRDARTIDLVPERIVASPVLERSATEHASARSL